MNKYFIIIVICLSSFLGGAFAQTIGGSIRANAAVVWLNLIGGLSGSATGAQNVNLIQTNTDNLATDSQSNIVSLLTVNHNFGGVAAVGGFVGSKTTINQIAKTGNTSSSDGGGNYVAALYVAQGTANDNGISPTPLGSLFGTNPNCRLTTAATFWFSLICTEIDIAVDANSSVADLIGQQIVATSSHVTAGSRSNIGSAINNAPGVPGWDCAYCIGSYSGNFPVSSTGTIMGAWPHGIARNGSGGSMPTDNAGTALYGVDFSNVTFAAGGAPYLAPLITPASSGTTCRAGSIEWDASFIYVCTATNTWKRATLAGF